MCPGCRVTDRGIPSRLPVVGDEVVFFGLPDYSPTWAEVDAFSGAVTHDFSERLRLVNQPRLAHLEAESLYNPTRR